ncbi:MAG: WS/DGAT domain-containing protein [Mycobacterium sp.]
MEQRRRLGVQDALWLEMDRPNNLMVVDSVIWTAQPLDFAKVRAVVEERLLNRYPVFRSLAVKDDDGSWWWEIDENFNFDNHVALISLKKPDDPRALQEVVGAHRTEMLDRNRPLWQAIWVKRYRGGSAMILRSHHAIADGMRMVQLSMSLFDATPQGGPILAPAVTQQGVQLQPPGQSLTQRVRATAAEATRVAGAAISRVTDAIGGLTDAPQVLQQAGRLGRFALRNPLGAGDTLVSAAQTTGAAMVQTVRSALPGGGSMVDAFSAAPGDVDTLRKLLIGTRNDATIWTGTAGEQKSVAWSEPMSLAAIRAVAKANRCTVNDVLVTTVAGTLHDYLEAHNARCHSVTFMVPVNLKPIDLTLPDTLGNEFALVQLELPTDEPDAGKVLEAAKRRMERIKLGHEAAVAFRLQETIAGFSRSLYEASVDLFTNRTLGTLTNVPGPPMPVYLAGSLVDGMVGWAPISGDQPMSFTIYSYDGEVTIGIACDTKLVPDHEMIIDGFAAAFTRLVDATPGADLMQITWGGAGRGPRGPKQGPGRGRDRRR